MRHEAASLWFPHTTLLFALSGGSPGEGYAPGVRSSSVSPPILYKDGESNGAQAGGGTHVGILGGKPRVMARMQAWVLTNHNPGGGGRVIVGLGSVV